MRSRTMDSRGAGPRTVIQGPVYVHSTQCGGVCIMGGDGFFGGCLSNVWRTNMPTLPSVTEPLLANAER